MSRISLCLIDGNPPREQLIACSTVSCLPQTQWEGRRGTDTVGRQAWRAPTTPPAEGIPEGTFVEGETVFRDG